MRGQIRDQVPWRFHEKYALYCVHKQKNNNKGQGPFTNELKTIRIISRLSVYFIFKAYTS